MAESQLKREREEALECDENAKRQRQSYNQILSLLDEEEDVSNQDLSDMFKTLQEELSSDSDSTTVDPSQSCTSTEDAGHQSGGAAVPEYYSPSFKEDDEEEARINVMRHLLEASDDELGLPSISESGDEETNSGETLFNLGEGLWEFEDDAANYYTLLQSELFM